MFAASSSDSGPLVCVGIAVVILVSFFVLRGRANAAKERERREAIYRRFGRGDVAEKIIHKQIWVGETAEQLQWSLGSPADIDEKVLKTKRKQIWKYGQTSAKRFNIKITLENDVVVGWDVK